MVWRAGARAPKVEHRPSAPKAVTKGAAQATAPQDRVLLLQGAAGNAAVARALAVQRDIAVETDQQLPRAVVALDPKDTRRLVVHYGEALVAVVEVTGGYVDAIQIRDRTGSRNEGRTITAIDLDIVHAPGVTVTLTPVRAGLAAAQKALGVGEITLTEVERQPPYGVDELQLWPPAHALGPQRQRRDLTPQEQKAEDDRHADERAREADTLRQVAELRKEYTRLTAATDSADRYLENLYGIGLIFQMMTQLPEPTLYNGIRRDLFEAGKALDYRSPGRARVLLKRADAALWQANGQVSAAVHTGIENTNTAIRVTQTVSVVSTIVGKTLARMIPGPVGKVLTILAEVLEPAPQTLDQLSERLMGAAQVGQGLAHDSITKSTPPKGSGTATVPDETPTVRDSSKKTPTVPEETPEGGGGGGGGGGSRSSTTPKDQKTVKGGVTPEEETPTTAIKIGGRGEDFVVDKAARFANRPSPTLEDFSGFSKVAELGGPSAGGAGINRKFVLKGPDGKQYMFKPADYEEGMAYGPALGIKTGERYRRAAATAFVADKLGVDTPGVRLGVWNGLKGSLQEWRPGYRTATEVKATNAAKFQRFWDSQQRKDLDALDYVTAQQDRHPGNVMLKDKPGGGTEMLAIDQDAGFPTSSKRFDPKDLPKYPRIDYQRPLAATISNDMARRMRDLNQNWPEAELRQWLTQPEVDGARARLTEIITKLDDGTLTVVTR